MQNATAREGGVRALAQESEGVFVCGPGVTGGKCSGPGLLGRSEAFKLKFRKMTVV